MMVTEGNSGREYSFDDNRDEFACLMNYWVFGITDSLIEPLVIA